MATSGSCQGIGESTGDLGQILDQLFTVCDHGQPKRANRSPVFAPKFALLPDT